MNNAVSSPASLAMNNDQQINEQIGTLADHLLVRRNSILKNWRHAVDEDPAVTSASTLARKEFYDHIPAVLDTFDQMLRARYLSEKAEAAQEKKEQAAEHGLHRWHHGYNQRDGDARMEPSAYCSGE
jgi:hypothetical protein